MNLKCGFIPNITMHELLRFANVLEIEVHEYVEILRQIAEHSRFLYDLCNIMTSSMHFDES